MVSDLLCNGGGVTVSWFEMVQNAYGYREEEGVHQRLETEVPAIKEREIPITPYINFIYASGPVFFL